MKLFSCIKSCLRKRKRIKHEPPDLYRKMCSIETNTIDDIIDPDLDPDAGVEKCHTFSTEYFCDPGIENIIHTPVSDQFCEVSKCSPIVTSGSSLEHIKYFHPCYGSCKHHYLNIHVPANLSAVQQTSNNKHEQVDRIKLHNTKYGLCSCDISVDIDLNKGLETQTSLFTTNDFLQEPPSLDEDQVKLLRGESFDILLASDPDKLISCERSLLIPLEINSFTSDENITDPITDNYFVSKPDYRETGFNTSILSVSQASFSSGSSNSSEDKCDHLPVYSKDDFQTVHSNQISTSDIEAKETCDHELVEEGESRNSAALSCNDHVLPEKETVVFSKQIVKNKSACYDTVNDLNNISKKDSSQFVNYKRENIISTAGNFEDNHSNYVESIETHTGVTSDGKVVVKNCKNVYTSYFTAYHEFSCAIKSINNSTIDRLPCYMYVSQIDSGQSKTQTTENTDSQIERRKLLEFAENSVVKYRTDSECYPDVLAIDSPEIQHTQNCCMDVDYTKDQKTLSTVEVQTDTSYEALTLKSVSKLTDDSFKYKDVLTDNSNINCFLKENNENDVPQMKEDNYDISVRKMKLENNSNENSVNKMKEEKCVAKMVENKGENSVPEGTSHNLENSVPERNGNNLENIIPVGNVNNLEKSVPDGNSDNLEKSVSEENGDNLEKSVPERHSENLNNSVSKRNNHNWENIVHKTCKIKDDNFENNVYEVDNITNEKVEILEATKVKMVNNEEEEIFEVKQVEIHDLDTFLMQTYDSTAFNKNDQSKHFWGCCFNFVKRLGKLVEEEKYDEKADFPYFTSQNMEETISGRKTLKQECKNSCKSYIESGVGTCDFDLEDFTFRSIHPCKEIKLWDINWSFKEKVSENESCKYRRFSLKDNTLNQLLVKNGIDLYYTSPNNSSCRNGHSQSFPKNDFSLLEHHEPLQIHQRARTEEIYLGNTTASVQMDISDVVAHIKKQHGKWSTKELSQKLKQLLRKFHVKTTTEERKNKVGSSKKKQVWRHARRLTLSQLIHNFFKYMESDSNFLVKTFNPSPKSLLKKILDFVPFKHENKLYVFPINGLQDYFNQMSVPLASRPAHAETMKFEWVRVRSFWSFPSNIRVSPLAMARVGFYYTGKCAETRCFSCGKIYKEWRDGDDPYVIHQQISPTCFYLNGHESGNVPIHEEDRLKPRPHVAQAIMIGSASVNEARAAALAETVEIPGISSAAISQIPIPSKEPEKSGDFSFQTNTTTQQSVSITSPSYFARPAQPNQNLTASQQQSSTNLSVVNTEASSINTPTPSQQPTPPTQGDLKAQNIGTVVNQTQQSSIVSSTAPSSTESSGIPPSSSSQQLPTTSERPALGTVSGSSSSTSTTSTSLQISTSASGQQTSTQSVVASSNNLTVNTQASSTGPSSTPLNIQANLTVSSSTPSNIQTSLTGSSSSSANTQSSSSSSRSTTVGSESTRSRFDPLGINFEKPKYPAYAVLTVRVNTYNGWPSYLDQTPRIMALAGFFYAGYGDYTRCFFCGGGLRNWEAGDDPWVEHARWFPKCAFLRQNRGERFINAVQMRHREATSSNQPIELPRQLSVLDQGNQGGAANIGSSVLVQTLKEMGKDDATINQAIEQWRGARRHLGQSAEDSEMHATEIFEIILKLEENRVQGSPSLEVAIQPTAQSKSISQASSLTTQQSGTDDSVTPVVAEGTEIPEYLQGFAEELEEYGKQKERLTCKICTEKPVAIAFLPCGHLVCCVDCAPAMRKCPLCNELVKGTIKTFFP